MSGPITWEMLLGFISLIGVAFAGYGYLNHQFGLLHKRINDFREEFHNHKLKVAETYVTNDDLAAVEARLKNGVQNRRSMR